ncbi:MAG TPA: YedE family putative selenium transporter [Candidatus Cloacimonadota bacterium]|nr:YedE family putative selenium transporter [Candidatus Cloacimonadota bacterium]
MKNFFSTRWGIIVVGAVIGILATLLQKFGNPANMGICVACFARDTAGALGFHHAGNLQYVRPELIGIILGSLVMALIFKEFKPRGGSATIVRFFLGIFAVIGALVFLGCPWRASLRLAGGDWNAIVGFAGLIGGIYIGTLFIKKGYNLGRSMPSNKKLSGWIFPASMIILLILLVFGFKKLANANPPHALLWISLGFALIIGALAQRSRFCTVGAFRDMMMIGESYLLTGLGTFIVVAFIMNLLLGQFHPGFANQPAAHTMHLWNFLGMVLAGLAFTLAGGCPGRQLVMAGEGDSDAAIFFLGLIVGAGLAHNFGLTSSGKGIGEFGAAGTIIGIIFCLIIGFTMVQKRK